jgi:hypothetical protein
MINVRHQTTDPGCWFFFGISSGLSVREGRKEKLVSRHILFNLLKIKDTEKFLKEVMEKNNISVEKQR